MLIRPFSSWFSRLLMGLDIITYTTSFFLTTLLAILWSIPLLTLHPFEILLSLLVTLALFFHFHLYHPFREKTLFFEWRKITTSLLLLFFCHLLYLLVTKNQHEFIKFLTLLFGMQTLAFIVQRTLLRLILRAMRQSGRNKKFMIVVGINPLVEEYLMRLQKHPTWGVEIIGYFHPCPLAISLSYLGTLDQVSPYLSKPSLDEVIFALPAHEEHHLSSFIDSCEREGKSFKILPSLYHYLPTLPHVEDLLGLPVITQMPIPLSPGYLLLLKRFIDILFASAILILFAPLFLLIALLIKLTSKGPIFFSQQRTGLKNRPFTILKFRTMVVNEHSDIQAATLHDTRFTPVGKWLRRFSIDETPQLINILKGEMSFVGPRPHMLSETQTFYEQYHHYLQRHAVKPGLTGWAQVNGLRGSCDSAKRLKYDLYYIKHWSLLLDIKIILLTALRLLFDRHAI